MKKLLVLGLLLGCDPAHSAMVYRCEDASATSPFPPAAALRTATAACNVRTTPVPVAPGPP